MQVLLMRHGHSVEPGSFGDSQRWLTQLGREQVRSVSQVLAAASLKPGQLYVSPLVRAVQTAELLAQGLSYSGTIDVHPFLVPGATTARALEVLERHGQGEQIALITHEPTVSACASFLLGSPQRFATGQAMWIEVPRTGPATLLKDVNPSDLG